MLHCFAAEMHSNILSWRQAALAYAREGSRVRAEPGVPVEQHWKKLSDNARHKPHRPRSLPPYMEDSLTSPVRVRASNVVVCLCWSRSECQGKNEEEAHRSIAAVG